MKVPAHNENRIWVLVAAIRDLAMGRNNSTGTFTCTASSATTVVTSSNVTENDWIGLMPLSAVAATEVGNGTIWVSAQQKGQFTVTHANSATAGRTFRYVVLGG